ncbi:hypothetical protein IGI49_004932, partial [Enterococcus sp. AZ071]
MTLSDYQQAQNEYEKHTTELTKVIKVHQEDPDLSHSIGSDKNCAYCDQYKKLNQLQEKLMQQLKTLERDNSV